MRLLYVATLLFVIGCSSMDRNLSKASRNVVIEPEALLTGLNRTEIVNAKAVVFADILSDMLNIDSDEGAIFLNLEPEEIRSFRPPAGVKKLRIEIGHTNYRYNDSRDVWDAITRKDALSLTVKFRKDIDGMSTFYLDSYSGPEGRVSYIVTLKKDGFSWKFISKRVWRVS